MNDPLLPPGYDFVGVRLRLGSVEILDEPESDVPGQVQTRYSDQLSVEEKTIGIRQRIEVSITSPTDTSKTYLKAIAEVEGVFQGREQVNIPPEEFASKVAPTVVFPFVREWIHKLTSQSGLFPPVLLPPMNVIAVREAGKSQPEPTQS